MQKTEKLYYENANILECEAQVLECIECDGKYYAVMDRSCFFPAGGGQPSDLGKVNDVDVIEVVEKDNVLTHVLAEKVESGSVVHMSVDKARRLDHCAQHTGEHMLSGLAKTLFGAVNCGFHMADTYSTLDFDIMLSDEQVLELEIAVNEKVRENVSICTEIVDEDKLKSLSLRKKTDGIETRADEFRIVYIEGVDSCTCCGSHCNYSGEVGIIKINACKKYKSGVRIWFLCGARALDDYVEKQRITDTIAKRFSTKQEEILNLVLKQGDELAKLKHTLKIRNTELAGFRSRDLYAAAEEVRGVRIVSVTEENADMQELKTLAEKLIECGKVIALLISHSDDEVIYVLASSEGVSPSMNELCATVNIALNGKGGGRAGFVQGKAARTSPSQLGQAVEQIVSYTKTVVNR